TPNEPSPSPRSIRAPTGVRNVSLWRSLIARAHGPSGCFPQGFVRRIRGDLGDRLGPIVRPTSGAAFPSADRRLFHLPRPRSLADRRAGHEGRLLRGDRVAGPEPRGPPTRCPAQDRHRTPVVRRADVRGTPDVRRRLEVDALVSSAEAHEPRGAAPHETGAGERLLNQGPGGGPEAPPGEPIELPGRRRRPLRGSLVEAPDLGLRPWRAHRRLFRLRKLSHEGRRVGTAG